MFVSIALFFLVMTVCFFDEPFTWMGHDIQNPGKNTAVFRLVFVCMGSLCHFIRMIL